MNKVQKGGIPDAPIPEWLHPGMLVKLTEYSAGPWFLVTGLKPPHRFDGYAVSLLGDQHVELHSWWPDLPCGHIRQGYRMRDHQPMLVAGICAVLNNVQLDAVEKVYPVGE